ncbi:MAG: asparagine synthase (glutamine-hydrolyzing) [Bdellovibrionales bacterium]|jgi:asparagine synthase (glutamine-hydrolysing)|nr:asparagine synthase (glutamine-hydrolyzing) [Bdellovibrionales bacterium]
MCGIIGIYNSRQAIDTKTLQSAADVLTHRGPDGAGFYISPNRQNALAHRRLSIIDIAAGAQPLKNETGDIYAVVNGEFYGHDALRQKLQSRGHVFATRSDSEILMHLYEEYGTACLDHLRGEFAFILHDTRKNIFFAARDRFGIKPLCYTQTPDGTLMLASEAKALFALGFAARWDMESFYTAASLQYTLPGRTLFDGVKQMKPGEMMIARAGHIETRIYWEMDFLPESQTETDETAAAEALQEALQDSVRERLCADVPLCFHLSGGLDSSGLLGLATAMTGRAQDAFTVRFNHAGYDEYDIAGETAAAQNARLHVVDVSQEDLVTHLPDAVYHGEGLAINGHLAGKYLLNRAIRKAGFKVALSGEGSDEVFAGYPHLRQDLWATDAVNDAQMQEREALLMAGNGASAGVQLAQGAGLSTAGVKTAMGYVPAFLAAKATLGHRIHALLSPAFKSGFAGFDPYAALMRESGAAQINAACHNVNRSAFVWSKTALANYILRTLGDGMDMAHSVEGRLPFLDHHLFALARRLPMGMKIKNGQEKYILRRALKPYITQTVYSRQKHPFMAPPVSLFSNPALRGMVADHFASQSFAALPFFDTKAARRLPDDFSAMTAEERRAQEPALMTLLTAHVMGQKFGLTA